MRCSAFFERLKSILQNRRKLIFYIIILVIFLYELSKLIPLLTTIKVDDTSYYTAAHGLRSRLNIYEENTFYKIGEELFGKSIEVWPYTYPPILAQLFIPLSYFSYKNFSSLILIINLILGFLCVLLTYRIIFGTDFQFKPILAMISFLIIESLPFYLNIQYGQVHFIIYLLILVSILSCQNGNDWLSSLALSLACLIKIFPAIYLIYFLINRKIKYIGYFVLNSTALVALSISFFGLKPWINFLHYFYEIFLGGKKTIFYLHYYAYQNNKSLISFLINLLESPPLSKYMRAIFLSIALLLFVLIILKIKKNIIIAFSLLTLFSLIISPMTWRHHFVVALLPILYICHIALKKKKFISLVFVLITGAIMFFFPNWSGFPFSYTILFSTILLFLFMIARYNSFEKETE